MKIFRLCKFKHSGDLSGHGARISGGRWNSKGIPVIYASESVALCTAEIAVHIPLGMLSVNYVLVTYELPDLTVLSIQLENLPERWNSYPHSSSTQQIGDKLLLNMESLILQVPSAVVPQESNFLINPIHKEINTVKILDVEPYIFDVRLFK